MDKRNYCVILAGGSGSRLWPMSREDKPKQFLDILECGKTLLQMTYERFAGFIDTDNIIIVTNQSYRQLVVDQLPGIKPGNILTEPMRRNTVPAVIWAALEVRRRCPDGRMVVSPSDQRISDGDAFRTDVLHGLDFAGSRDVLLTMGARPDRPEVSFGYIQMDGLADESAQIYKVRSFTEKPASEFAHIFFESGEFLWNTGLFLWTPSAFLRATGRASEEFVPLLQRLRDRFAQGAGADELLEEFFAKCPKMPLEQSVLEKADNVHVMLCHFGWADIGSWSAIHEAMPLDGDGNAVGRARALLYDCKDCVVKLPDGEVAVLQGLDGYVVAKQGNVLVVCRKDDQKNIRKFVNDAQMTLGEEFA